MDEKLQSLRRIEEAYKKFALAKIDSWVKRGCPDDFKLKQWCCDVLGCTVEQLDRLRTNLNAK